MLGRFFVTLLLIVMLAEPAQAGIFRHRRHPRPQPAPAARAVIQGDDLPTPVVSQPDDAAQTQADQFSAALNKHRAAHGCGPVTWDQGLTQDAATNGRRGGHHRFMGRASGQCWASPRDLLHSFRMWCHSPEHNGIMLGRGFRCYGISTGPSGCTLNMGL